jgi:hypothetical protein
MRTRKHPITPIKMDSHSEPNPIAAAKIISQSVAHMAGGKYMKKVPPGTHEPAG